MRKIFLAILLILIFAAVGCGYMGFKENQLDNSGLQNSKIIRLESNKTIIIQANNESSFQSASEPNR